MPEERNVRPCEELALPQPPKFGFPSQEDEQTSCTTSRLTLVLSMRERARLVWMRFIRLRVKICQLLCNTTFRGHNSMIRSRPDPLRAFTGSGCGYARLAYRINTHAVHFKLLYCNVCIQVLLLTGQAVTLGYIASYFTLVDPTPQDTTNTYLLSTGAYVT